MRIMQFRVIVWLRLPIKAPNYYPTYRRALCHSELYHYIPTTYTL